MLFKCVTNSKIEPNDLVCTHETLVKLVEFFAPDILVYTIPFLFGLQTESGGVDGSPKQRAVHNLVLQTFISIATFMEASDLVAHLNKVFLVLCL